MPNRTGKAHPVAVREAAVELYRAGLSTAEIAVRVKIPANTVYCFARDAGLDTSKKRRRPLAQLGVRCVRWADRPNGAEIDGVIRDEYPAAGPVPIAERFGLTKGIVSKRAWQLGVRCRTGAARRAATLVAANRSVAPGYFDRWAPNMAWLLGYTWTDGALSKNKIHYRCAVRDEHIIHDIRAELNCTAKVQRFAPQVVCVRRANRYTGRPQVGISISSQAACRALIDRHGVYPNKSGIDPEMPSVPDEYLGHFFRGVVDGDGYFCRKGRRGLAIGVVGSHRFLERFRCRVAEVASVPVPNRWRCSSSDKISQIAWNSADACRTLIAWMYPPGDYLHLRRKRRRAAEWLEYRGELEQLPHVQVAEGGYVHEGAPAADALDVVTRAVGDDLHPGGDGGGDE